MNVLFLPCTLDGYGPDTASLRFRCEYIAKYWPEADVYPKMRRAWETYDVYIFQKAYLTDRPKLLMPYCATKPGAIVAFDLCDSDWMQSDRHLRALVDALAMCDFAVAPTQPICDWLAQWTPARVIADRLDMAEFTERHTQWRDPPWLVWYGYAHNLGAIEPFWPLIEDRGLELTILSNECPRPWRDRPGVRFVKWTREGANSVIAAHDMALVTPASPYKSDNRAITAWALGVPTVTNFKEWNAYFAGGETDLLYWSDGLYQTARDLYDVRRSVNEWKAAIQSAYDHKSNGGKRVPVHNQAIA